MTTNFPTQIVECAIRLEIEDWFKKLINERFGSAVQFLHRSNDEHVNIYTNVEISVIEDQIKDVIEFMGNTSELLQYKLPWLNGSQYYVASKQQMNIVKENLKKIMPETHYGTTYYRIIGCTLINFNFRPDLDKTEKTEIDQIFKTVHKTSSIFITHPKTRATSSQSSSDKSINVLMAYNGGYLQYLNPEDILSLKIANNSQISGSDEYLDHDIQMYLRRNYPELYRMEEKSLHWDLKDFKISEVLRYFIHKYHNRFNKIYISNILPADEIKSLSQLYNIEIVCNNLIHIDFKSMNKRQSVDFCAIYHFDSDGFYFLNYDTKCASENHAVNFNADYSLDPLKCSTEFSYLVIKSQNSCSPHKTNSVLKCVTEQFIVSKHHYILILYEFDLIHVSRQLLNSLLKMMGQGSLQFRKMNFNFSTLSKIVEQSAENRIIFVKCRVALENVEVHPINSQKSRFELHEMDIDLNLLYNLNNLKYLEVKNCRLLSSSRGNSIKTEISENISFEYTNFDVATLLILLDGLQYAPNIMFKFCKLTSSDLVAKTHFVLRNKIEFQYMVFHLLTLFQLFDNCKVESLMYFRNCHFCHHNIESHKFQLRTVNIEFDSIKFDLPALLILLGSLNNKSRVMIKNSCILHLVDHFTSTKIIRPSYIGFEKCRLETNVLMQILGKTSKTTMLVINCCELLLSSAVGPTILTNLSEMDIQFTNMTIDTQFARQILRTNSEVIFDNCYLTFMSDEFSDLSIHSYVSFLNMAFGSLNQFKLLANFAPESRLRFSACRYEFTNLEISSIVLKPAWIYFEKITFDFQVLLTTMELISKTTEVIIDECIIRRIDPILKTLPIKMKAIRFINMSLQISTVLCILKGFVNLIELGFNNCKILCTNRDQLLNVILKPSIIWFNNMDIDINILETLVLQCTKEIIIWIDDCKIISSRSLSNRWLDIKRLVFKNVTYSPEVLLFLKHLDTSCPVKYLGQLSNRAIIEICTNSFVHGGRLLLNDQTCTKLFYFELFTEFYRFKALNYDFDPNMEYDLPTHLIPVIGTEFKYNWDEFTIKFVVVNDGTVKLDFFKNDKMVDLFFELNGLPGDCDECVVDYY